MNWTMCRISGYGICISRRQESSESWRLRSCIDVYKRQMLDMGVISEEEALKRMQARLETDHAKEMAALCLAHWHEYNMWPMESMGELVRELKAMGYGIYLCSNASERLLECYRIIPGIDVYKRQVHGPEGGGRWRRTISVSFTVQNTGR